MQKRHKIILLLLASTALAVSMMRELGFVDLSHYTFESQCNISQESETVRFSDELTISSPGVVVTLKSDSGFGRAVKAELEQLKSKPGVELAISVNQIDVAGLYWPPLLKRGHCVFQLQVRVTEGSAIRDISISGEMELSVKGVCSILKFRQLLAKQVVQESMKYIEQ